MPRLLQVIDNLTNWYIRFNRKRLKGVAGLGMNDTRAALNTLLQVLFTMVRALAPFIPFLTEHIYQLLRPHLVSATASCADARSVHFLPFPTVQEALFDAVIERQVSVMQKVIQLGRVARERRGLSLKTPLLSLVVIADSQPLADINSLKSYVQEELNVRDVVLTDDEERFGIRLEARVDWPSLGKKLKKDVQVVRRMLPTLSQAQLREYQRTKAMELDGISLVEGDLTLVRVIGKGQGRGADGSDVPQSQWEPAFADDMIVLLDVAPHPELVEEGLVRELVSRFQRLRKKAGLVPTDEVCMRQRVISDPDGVGLGSLVAARQDLVVAALRGRVEEAQEQGVAERHIIVEEEQVIGTVVVVLQLARV